MTEHRRPSIPFSEAPRGTCRWCGEEILYEEGKRAGTLDRRRRWHPKCVAEYNLSDPREARTWLRRRQRGICQSCGLDTYAVRREMQKIRRGRAAEMRKRGFKPRKSLWELDHVVPLIDGGTHARENLQTLCVPCHREKSAEEARGRAVRRRAEAAAALERGEAIEPEAPTPAAAAGEGGAEARAVEPRRAEPAKSQAPKAKRAKRKRPAVASEGRRRTRRQTGDLEQLLQGADAANARAEQLLTELENRPR